METTLALAVFVILLLIVTISILLHVIRRLCKKIHQFDDAAVWHRLAFTDGLTGVYNRTAYNEFVSEIQKSGEFDGLGILLFDIDDFKRINDEQGHLEGDRILRFVAKTLLSIFTPVRYRVFRIGGDEFAVISEKTKESELIEALIKLRDIFEAKSDICVSKGYSIIIDGDLKNAFKIADEMLYADKASRKKSSG